MKYTHPFFSYKNKNVNRNGQIVETSAEESEIANPLKLTPQLLDFLIAQLNLYSSVSFDRNYLWKKEITSDNNFPKNYLLINMWNKDMPLSKMLFYLLNI